MHGAKAGLLGAAAARDQLKEARGDHRSEHTVGRAGSYRIFQKRAQGDTRNGSTVASLRTGRIWI